MKTERSRAQNRLLPSGSPLTALQECQFRRWQSMLGMALMVILFGACRLSTKEEPAAKTLFPITDGKLWGFIDVNGKTVIKPQYGLVQEFSEGLAAVRVNGLYGFINEQDQMVIPAKYDMAEPFVDSTAVVYLGSKPVLINREGKQLWGCECASIHRTIDPELFIDRNAQDLLGLIHRNGKRLLDPIFHEIQAYPHHLVVASGRDRDPQAEGYPYPYYHELINVSTGSVVEVCKYRAIMPFGQGYFQVIDSGYKHLIISEDGKILATEQNLAKGWRFPWDPITSNQYITVSRSYQNEEGYDESEYGVVDAAGRLLFSDRKWDRISNFEHGCAIAKDTNDRFWLIDPHGKPLYPGALEKVYADNPWDYMRAFEEGVMIARKGNLWVGIDTMGAERWCMANPERTFANGERSGDFLYSHDGHTDEKGDYVYKWTFCNAKEGRFDSTEYDFIDQTLGKKALTRVQLDGQLAYINDWGTIVWQAPKPKGLQPLDVDYLMNGHCDAGSPDLEKYRSFGGWWSSSNMYLKVTDSVPCPKGRLNLALHPELPDTFLWAYQGMSLILSNTTPDTIVFDAQNSRLPIVLQAVDKWGNWTDIQYLSSSFCGNSYHQRFLPPGHFWSFPTPVFDGAIETRMRAKFLYKRADPEKGIPAEVLYSNEVATKLNPAQFWRKREYFPQGLMDPRVD